MKTSQRFDIWDKQLETTLLFNKIHAEQHVCNNILFHEKKCTFDKKTRQCIFLNYMTEKLIREESMCGKIFTVSCSIIRAGHQCHHSHHCHQHDFHHTSHLHHQYHHLPHHPIPAITTPISTRII